MFVVGISCFCFVLSYSLSLEFGVHGTVLASVSSLLSLVDIRKRITLSIGLFGEILGNGAARQ